MSKTIIPDGYKSKLNLYDTQTAIGFIKNVFQHNLGLELNLKRVTAPLFVLSESILLYDNTNAPITTPEAVVISPISATLFILSDTMFYSSIIRILFRLLFQLWPLPVYLSALPNMLPDIPGLFQ